MQPERHRGGKTLRTWPWPRQRPGGARNRRSTALPYRTATASAGRQSHLRFAARARAERLRTETPERSAAIRTFRSAAAWGAGRAGYRAPRSHALRGERDTRRVSGGTRATVPTECRPNTARIATAIAATLVWPPNSATKRPPGRRDLATPASTASASGTQCRTAFENTASNSPRNGRLRASTRWASTPRAAAAFTMSGDASTPVTRAPAADICAVSTPSPHPRSSMRSPALGSRRAQDGGAQRRDECRVTLVIGRGPLLCHVADPAPRHTFQSNRSLGRYNSFKE